MKQLQTAPDGSEESRDAAFEVREGDGGKSIRREEPGDYGLQTPVSFEEWREALDAFGLPEEEILSFSITIKWYLGYCKHARCWASKASANAFVQTVKPRIVGSGDA